ncbi:FimD/PapC C-terminal domain-containing protein [Diaphorobacter aerolatus]|uniref:PapC-like C-terminal domain-containing protein n=1 Tax=Diaphorobacter aerolatus TaxID=1288495 RepID=A0A7H0GME8_9BURK|nr:FimD/PapC C-terminal domain-containing protein [Diaphorobacter aerolatus]QNP49464.1 hypothetical protein H9K75_05445 [Diaphorobacter aerolatus]
MLIRVRLPSGSSIPMGADVYADGDEPVAMVGQGNQIYLRAEKSAGQLLVKWGDSAAERCTLDYATTPASAHSPVAGITMLERTCR